MPRLLTLLSACSLMVSACDGGVASIDGGDDPSDAATTDAATSDAAATDGGVPSDGGGTPDDAGPEPDAGPPSGDVWARIHASREVIREPAADAPATDSQTVLTAEVPAAVTAWRWQVKDSDTGATLLDETSAEVTFACPESGRGAYDVLLTVSGALGSASYRERRLVTCTLPRTDAGRTVHEVDLTVSSYFTNGTIAGNPVNPGDVIRIRGSFDRSWGFLNFHGTAEQPIHVINDGLVRNTSDRKPLHIVNCRHFIVDGFGDDAHPYGIVLEDSAPTGEQALFVRSYTEGTNTVAGSTGIEIYGVHVADTPGSGISVDTHGYAGFNRDNWRFDGLRVHHNRVENAGLEGFYLGYTRDWVGAAETHTAYQLHDAKVYRNEIRNTGYDGLQICNAVEGLEIHDNLVVGAGAAGNGSHSSSLQYNSGNGGHVYNNVFIGGTGLNIQGGCTGGSSWFYGNVFERGLTTPAATNPSIVYVIAGSNPGVTYHFFANTFRTRGAHGVSVNLGGPLCNDGSPVRLDGVVSINNIFLLPDEDVGSRLPAAFRYDSPMTIDPAVVSLPNVVATEADLASFCFDDPSTGDYAATCDTSPALAGDAAMLGSIPGTAPADLPGGVFTDLTARVLADPRNYGAHQLAAP